MRNVSQNKSIADAGSFFTLVFFGGLFLLTYLNVKLLTLLPAAAAHRAVDLGGLGVLRREGFPPFGRESRLWHAGSFSGARCRARCRTYHLHIAFCCKYLAGLSASFCKQLSFQFWMCCCGFPFIAFSCFPRRHLPASDGNAGGGRTRGLNVRSSGEGNDMAIKLGVWKTAGETFGFAFNNLFNIMRLFWFALALNAALGAAAIYYFMPYFLGLEAGSAEGAPLDDFAAMMQLQLVYTGLMALIWVGPVNAYLKRAATDEAFPAWPLYFRLGGNDIRLILGYLLYLGAVYAFMLVSLLPMVAVAALTVWAISVSPFEAAMDCLHSAGARPSIVLTRLCSGSLPYSDVFPGYCCGAPVGVFDCF